ncbi:MAG: DUF4258 domain-containing protein [Chloroflexi bacterium]|nr:DUF4258 domain-containing protein [Chloroflexota bacterium]
MELDLSDHARRRCAQRNLSYNEVLFICQYGKRAHNAGVIFCQLRRDRMPKHIPANNPYQRLIGTTIVLSSCGHVVVTVYREGEAFHEDLKKSKYCWHRHTSCPHCSTIKAAGEHPVSFRISDTSL